MATILVDYDGTCVPALPEPGLSKVDVGSERVLRALVEKGHDIILWTCRNNDPENPYNQLPREPHGVTSLEEAIQWFVDRDIPLSGINEVPGETDVIGNSRKALGDLLIDDTALGCPLTHGPVEFVSYVTGEITTIDTYCVDWLAVEHILKEMKLL